ncbi:MAG TPA: hypothetical protein VF503_16115 [Sphingobium sp.]|uniref:hypothetical protein n=1 Tax=Sphingobium sp. TaxID=1912891 RepID=UPI002ED2D5F5
MGTAWTVRASWSGFARALLAQGEEIEEIDIFARECGVPVPGRPPLATIQTPFEALPRWQDRFTGNRHLHWTDGLPFNFDPPEKWQERPALLRALDLMAHWARVDPSETPWLELPLLLQRMGFVDQVLPNIVAGDKALRVAPTDREAIVMRFLRSIATAAEDGLAQLSAIEADRLRAAGTFSREHRLGKLQALVALLIKRPLLSPTLVSETLSLSISGAGKLLDRAQSLGLCREVSGRMVWRLYLAPDLATRFGFVKPPRGRPAAPPPPLGSLDSILSAFDAEMAAIDALLGREYFEAKSD